MWLTHMQVVCAHMQALPLTYMLACMHSPPPTPHTHVHACWLP